MNKVEFEKWVNKMMTEYRKTAKRFTITVNDYTGTTLCGDAKTGKCAMARCHPNDNYNYSYGKAIAYARCRGYAIPKLTIYKKLSEMEYGDRFFLNACSNEIYAFIGHSFAIDTYIIEKVKNTCLYYLDDDIEYEMVE